MAGPSVLHTSGGLAAVRSGGGGDPMVLVHGSWVDRTTFDRLAPLLEPSVALLRYDRRGHGESAPPNGPYDPEQDAADLAHLLEELDLFPAHLVGHSLGGNLALRLALERPELVRGLVLHEPPLFGLLPADSPGLEAFRIAADGVAARVADGDRRGAAAQFVEEVAGLPGGWAVLPPSLQELMVAHADRWLAEYSAPGTFAVDVERLRQFDPPVLLTVGGHGDPKYRAIAEELVRALPNAELRTLPGAGHVPQATHAALFAGAILAFTMERSVPPA